MKRVTFHFDMEEDESRTYVSRVLECMKLVAQESDLGVGEPPQEFKYQQGSVVVEWVSPKE